MSANADSVGRGLVRVGALVREGSENVKGALDRDKSNLDLFVDSAIRCCVFSNNRGRRSSIQSLEGCSFDGRVV
ncbi:hypothetical protein VNO80_09930 [Phaseolus coccineus]|uniref:Uncharacterized protein n=1 Tax=Phaseolus coccineus TaxID=3886 RepID=A0AAN9RA20_PHACN